MVVNTKIPFDKGLKDTAASHMSFPDKTATIFGNSNGGLRLNPVFLKINSRKTILYWVCCLIVKHLAKV